MVCSIAASSYFRFTPTFDLVCFKENRQRSAPSTPQDEDVAQNFKSGQQFGVAEYINARAEDV